MTKVYLALIVLLVVAIGGFVYHSQKQKPVEAATSISTAVKRSATKASPPAVAFAPNACAGNSSGQEVIVSIAQQHMWACSGAGEVYESAATTGATAYGDGTPTGSWKIYSKQTNTYLKGSDDRGSWNDLVNYWMPFYGAYGFHDASWQTFPFGDLTAYTTQGSHGCVHLPLTAMKWLYDWAPIGTTVTIET